MEVGSAAEEEVKKPTSTPDVHIEEFKSVPEPGMDRWISASEAMSGDL